MNILVCEDPDKDDVMASIKARKVCTKFVGLVDDYAYYPNGYPVILTARELLY